MDIDPCKVRQMAGLINGRSREALRYRAPVSPALVVSLPLPETGSIVRITPLLPPEQSAMLPPKPTAFQRPPDTVDPIDLARMAIIVTPIQLRSAQRIRLKLAEGSAIRVRDCNRGHNWAAEALALAAAPGVLACARRGPGGAPGTSLRPADTGVRPPGDGC